MDTQARYTLSNCPKCAAPLPEVGPEATHVTCEYCGAQLQKERPASAPEADAVWVSFASTQLAAGTLARAKRRLVFTLLTVLAVPAFVVGALVLHQVKQALPTALTLPATCDTNGELVLSGRTYDGPGPVVKAGTLCKVTIRNSTLRSDEVVHAGTGAEITVIDSTLVGRTVAVALETNAKLHVRGKSELSGGQTAIDADVNAELSVEGGTVKGEEAALRAKSNAKVRLMDATVIGKETALSLDTNGTLSAERSRLEADTVVRVPVNAQLRLVDSELKGREAALSLDDNAHVQVSGGALRANEVAIVGKSNLELTVRAARVEGGESAIQAGSGATVTLSQKAELRARDRVLVAAQNLTLKVEDASVMGGRTAVETGGNPKVRLLEHSALAAQEVALQAGDGLQLRMDGARLEAGETALSVKRPAEVVLKNARVLGGVNAFFMQRKPGRLELNQSELKGAQVLDGRLPLPAEVKVAAKPVPPPVPRAPAPPPVAVPQGPPPFNAAAARRALDDAVAEAVLRCRLPSTGNRILKLWMAPGFVPDGRNALARMTYPPEEGTKEAACAEAIFRKVRIPPFRENTGENLSPRRAFYLK